MAALTTDQWALAIAISAIVISIGTTLYTVFATERISRQQTFQRLHEALVSPAASEGRRILFTYSKSDAFPQLDSKDWDKINYSLALYDTLGSYIDNRMVPRRMVLRSWYHPVSAVTPPVIKFLEHRRQLGIDQPWPFLQMLLKEVQSHQCKCPTCALGYNPVSTDTS